MKFRTSILAIAAVAAFTATPIISANADTVSSTNTTIQPLPYASSSTQVNTATSSTSTATVKSSSTSDSTSTAVVTLAKKLASENIPYVWGGESLKGMDCSGLTDYVYRNAANIQLGHYTVTQEGKVTTKAVADAKPGDLLFWGTYHVAIYIGNNQFVAAPQPGQNVEIETINSAFMPSFAGTVNR
ncbi:hypothetical protein C5L31_000270 [Secundilactobacillus malefermentans]|uniref:NlpC/P60 domain-containing protein n=1 Tax=Secundilactobacillus malefermentans TaxID=176292 RepID=A0A4R5NFX3_9LACO|nr:C40 family peptidase [Secundilactobacillus malefermentans]KRM57575.1 NLP P60 protein [Secundilactobacillus malefermentans DSM 5705 = KCTC 3548]TDG72945.1 hypothetical protein C5L31_000270 [Secundilactobacillus malefermentans]